ncbi:MAG: M20 family metallopeptidase [Pyrinomonadaceae bacterium]
MIARTTFSDTIKSIAIYLREQQSMIEQMIRSVVEIESPSGDEAGSRDVVDLLARSVSPLACVESVKRVPVAHLGEHLIIRAFGKGNDQGTLLVGHTDTVHSRGSLALSPWRVNGNQIYGPGIFDMKANCILSVAVLQAFDILKLEPSGPITIVLTCDEEIGSHSGWPLLESIAQTDRPARALVLEPPAHGGSVKTARKGTGMFSMRIAGKAAHAGLEPEKGASAILELARQTERLHTLNRSGSGITVNVGVVRGGTRSNVVAAEAEAEIDVRFSTLDEAKEIERILLNLKPVDERVKMSVSGGINRPPLERTPSVVQLFEKAKGIADALDYDLEEAQVGGASDGNFLAAMGIPVLDGLGIRGDGAHAEHEHIERNDIPVRGALLAGLML